ncbi:hypothetical protein CgunFtcFv8_004930 [Champsocephalus gunnari]|uniref:Uncharacterized protein n=1 Tax=Champsocephalus gunnari TaxID=52237 RepID=A0AAN8CUJ5_CHAGU|nr:hypothetical protein CgunFtcFv8_004930 [Champsocephalus gunnari]
MSSLQGVSAHTDYTYIHQVTCGGGADRKSPLMGTGEKLLFSTHGPLRWVQGSPPRLGSEWSFSRLSVVTDPETFTRGEWGCSAPVCLFLSVL